MWWQLENGSGRLFLSPDRPRPGTSNPGTITGPATHTKNKAQPAQSPLFYKPSKSSLYSPYYAEACNELRGPSPRLSAWATQLRRSVATVASRWRHCVDLTGTGIEPQTSRTDSVRLATELTAGILQTFNHINQT